VVKLAGQTGETFGRLFLRLSDEANGRALFYYRMFCKDMDELADLFRSRNILPSLGDAARTYRRSWTPIGRPSLLATGSASAAITPWPEGSRS